MDPLQWSIRLGGPFLGAVALHRWGRHALPANARADAVVVAGCPPRPDGTPTPSLERRALEGARLVLEERAPLLVLTGAAIGGRRSEAEVAAEVAMRAGVPASRILLEERSTTTAENAEHAYALLGDIPVVVVSDAFHAWRCRQEFLRWFSRVEAHGAPTPPATALKQGVRESLIVMARRWPQSRS